MGNEAAAKPPIGHIPRQAGGGIGRGFEGMNLAEARRHPAGESADIGAAVDGRGLFERPLGQMRAQMGKRRIEVVDLAAMTSLAVIPECLPAIAERTHVDVGHPVFTHFLHRSP